MEGDRIYATLAMPQGINVEYTEAAAEQIEDAAIETARQIDEELGNKDKSVVLQVFQLKKYFSTTHFICYKKD